VTIAAVSGEYLKAYVNYFIWKNETLLKGKLKFVLPLLTLPESKVPKNLN